MVAALFAAPAVLALTLTLPVIVTPRNGDDFIEKEEAVVEGAPTLGNLIDFEEEGIERPLVAAQEQVEDILEEEMHFNKWLMATQCVCGPLFCAAVLFGRCQC
jgi:sodium/potassium/calcium exchanger 6